MTHTLFLMRHAKAGEASRDHARPLAERGRRQANEVGGLVSKVAKIDLVWVSDATRTLQTLEGMRSGGLEVSGVSEHPEFYIGTWRDAIEVIRSGSEDIEVGMYLGHEPTTNHLSQLLLGDDKVVWEVAYGFPTAGCLQLKFEGTWADLAEGKARYVDFFASTQ